MNVTIKPGAALEDASQIDSIVNQIKFLMMQLIIQSLVVFKLFGVMNYLRIGINIMVLM